MKNRRIILFFLAFAFVLGATSFALTLRSQESSVFAAATDYAVAANCSALNNNGYATFADTVDGLEVTFINKTNSFQIHFGDMTSAYVNGYYLRFI